MIRPCFILSAFVKVFVFYSLFLTWSIYGQEKDTGLAVENDVSRVLPGAPSLNQIEGLQLQSVDQNKILTLEEFLGMIKAYHPYVKQAKIDLSAVEADLLASRGVFDPKLSVKGASKTFDGENYYEKLGATFKIPTYFGIDLIGTYDRNEGNYLNPSDYLSNGVLYSVGADIDLARGFWANERLNTLKQAKLYTRQAEEKVLLQVNKILFEATQSYLKWYESYAAYRIWQQFVDNAEFRLSAVRSAFERGDVAAIDTTEARIALNARALSFQQAKLDLRQSALKVSNYLWLDQVPLELSSEMRPEENLSSMHARFVVLNNDLTKHPLLRAGNFGVAAGRLDQRLKTVGLLPEMTLGYRWLSGDRNFEQLGWALDPQNNSTQFKLALPLFLRKERGALKLSQLKLQEAELNLAQNTLELSNKIQGLEWAVDAVQQQSDIASRLVSDYQVLYNAEQVKFSQGESSLFLVNNRESNYIESILKRIKTDASWVVAQADLYFNLVF